MPFVNGKFNLTTKDTKITKFGKSFIRTLRVLRALVVKNSFPSGCGGTALGKIAVLLR